MDPLQQIEEALKAEVAKMQAAGKGAQEIGSFVEQTLKSFTEAVTQNMTQTVDGIRQKFGGGGAPAQGGGAPGGAGPYSDPEFQKFARGKMQTMMQDPNLQFGPDFAKNLDSARAGWEQEFMQGRGGGGAPQGGGMPGAMSEGDMGFQSIIDDEQPPGPPDSGFRAVPPGHGKVWNDDPNQPDYTSPMPQGSMYGQPFPTEREFGGGDSHASAHYRWDMDNNAPGEAGHDWKKSPRTGHDEFTDDYERQHGGQPMLDESALVEFAKKKFGFDDQAAWDWSQEADDGEYEAVKKEFLASQGKRSGGRPQQPQGGPGRSRSTGPSAFDNGPEPDVYDARGRLNPEHMEWSWKGRPMSEIQAALPDAEEAVAQYGDADKGSRDWQDAVDLRDFLKSKLAPKKKLSMMGAGRR